jgi:hypothetical protein
LSATDDSGLAAHRYRRNFTDLTTEQLPFDGTNAFRQSFPIPRVSMGGLTWRKHMSMLKTVTLAAALIAGSTSLAMAQYGGPQYGGPQYGGPQYGGPGGDNSSNGNNGNNGMPPSAYLGPGGYPSYKGSDYQRPSNATNNMPPDAYKGPGGMQNYSSSDFQQGNQAANPAAPAASGGQPLYSYNNQGPGPAPANAAWCQVHYRSYNPATGMFRGFNGVMHPCP